MTAFGIFTETVTISAPGLGSRAGTGDDVVARNRAGGNLGESETEEEKSVESIES